jgi:abortive infection bacteriophage resistance protein
MTAIETAIQRERLARYRLVKGGSIEHALNMYLWNCTLCQAFHTPLHFAEVLHRNAINQQLTAKLGPLWFENTTFKRLLGQRTEQELIRTIERERQQHGTNLTVHNIVSALPLGFWEQMTTRAFRRILWPHGVQNVFRHTDRSTTTDDITTAIRRVRLWRNRIAHHEAIFDKNPLDMHQQTLKLIHWVCPVTAAWVESISSVPDAFRLRPEPS